MTSSPLGRTDDAVATPLVDVVGLDVRFGRGADAVHAVRGLDLTVGAGEVVALVGESGSGKSVTARTLVGLTGAGAQVHADRLSVFGEDVRFAGDRHWRTLRGRRIGFVLQDALGSLDPLRTIGAEVGEVLLAHNLATRSDVSDRVEELLRDVGIPDPAMRARQRPHELSGGLRQRALIASAIAADPELVIADEPTTALDATVRLQVLELLARSVEAGRSLLLISHDLSVVAKLAHRILVMHDGRVVESGETLQVLSDPQHDYTRRLLASVPSARTRGRLLSTGTPAPRRAQPTAVDSAPVLRVRDVGRTFAVRGRHDRLVAVEDVSFDVAAAETVGIVGSSGSGKTTVARIVLGLTEPETGSVELAGSAWSGVPERVRRDRRSTIGFVAQDPLSSFDPRHRVERLLRDGLRLRADGTGDATDERVQAAALLEQVGLPIGTLSRHPRELSGGQRQRVAIARALAARPRLLVCDEPVSALDVSVQAGVLDLLQNLQAEYGTALLFISHDLGVVHHLADRVLVMSEARIIERGTAEDVLSRPQHAVTRALVTAVPQLPEAVTTTAPSRA
jgi:peptide/nickel transport system ATP-binding protein